MKQKTWERVNLKDVPKYENGVLCKVLKGTWTLKLKRLLDGTPSRYKAKYCVRGDLQTDGVNFFEPYDPVVQWPTIRLVPTMIISNGRHTKQVEYTNIFAQAEINEEIYIEPPCGFDGADKIPQILKLLSSIYGLKKGNWSD